MIICIRFSALWYWKKSSVCFDFSKLFRFILFNLLYFFVILDFVTYPNFNVNYILLFHSTAQRTVFVFVFLEQIKYLSIVSSVSFTELVYCYLNCFWMIQSTLDTRHKHTIILSKIIAESTIYYDIGTRPLRKRKFLMTTTQLILTYDDDTLCIQLYIYENIQQTPFWLANEILIELKTVADELLHTKSIHNQMTNDHCYGFDYYGCQNQNFIGFSLLLMTITRNCSE